MRFVPYSNYKDSGVEWLGNIPSDWKVVRFSTVFTENKRKNKGLIEKNVLSLSYGNIKEKNIETNKGLLPESFETYQIVEPNDIIFRFTDLQNDKKSLRNGISKYHGIITSAYLNVKTNQDADYYNYLFRSYDLQKVFYSMGDGMRQSLKIDELNLMPILLPDLDKQKDIVEFLKIEMRKIDNLISKQEQLIKLLDEQRKAVILQAITKGLNLDLSMKQSGIDWIGAMPKKWQLKRLKQIASVVLGKMICNENQGDMLLKPYLKSKNIQWLNVNLNSVDEMWFSAKELDMYKLHKDDLILSEGGEVGKTCIWNNELDECYIQNSAHKVTLCEGYNAHYYLYFFYSMGHLGQFDRVINKVSIAHLTKEKLLNIPVLIPSIDEQNQIVEFIESENRKINNLINKQSKLIEKLKEYRSSIISHAVTGKIDVREAL